MENFRVYALFDTIKSNIRYIGYSSKPLSVRMGQHISMCSFRDSRKNEWLLDAIESERPIGIVELAKFSTSEEALEYEKKMIEVYSKTHSLTNSSTRILGFD